MLRYSMLSYHTVPHLLYFTRYDVVIHVNTLILKCDGANDICNIINIFGIISSSSSLFIFIILNMIYNWVVFIYLFISNKVKMKMKVILALTKDFCFCKNFTIVHNLTGHHTQNSQHSQTSILHFRVQCSQLLGTLIVHLYSKISSSKVSRSLLIIISPFMKCFFWFISKTPHKIYTNKFVHKLVCVYNDEPRVNHYH